MKIVQLVKSTQRGDSDAMEDFHKRNDACHRVLHDNGFSLRAGCDRWHVRTEFGSRVNLLFQLANRGNFIRRFFGQDDIVRITHEGNSAFNIHPQTLSEFRLKRLLAPLCLLLSLSNCDGSWSSYTAYDEIRGKVVRVADGDTITIREPDSEQTKVRLFGIDAPERGQAFGQKSRRTLAGLIANQTVDILIEDEDQYGRIVGIVLLDEENINLSMVKSGMAWVYRRYQDDPEWLEAEANARDAGRGLWSVPNPEPPADWRYRNRN